MGAGGGAALPGGGRMGRGPAPVPPPTDAPRGTHGLKLLVGVEAGLSSRREVAENPESVSRAALVGVDPVFPCAEPGAGEGW